VRQEDYYNGEKKKREVGKYDRDAVSFEVGFGYIF
jgi:hypothetical protein